MKKILWVLGLFSQVIAVHAQQIFNTAGTQSVTGSIQLDWSLGELSVQAMKTDYVWNTEGVLQPQAGTTTTLPPAVNNMPVLAGYGLDNSGTYLTNSDHNLMIEFTIGEMASKTLEQNNAMFTQGLLQPYQLNATLPVTGLEFIAKRLNGQQVRLDWKTTQELNNKGFYIERRLDSDTSFRSMKFAESKAVNGQSSFPLQYSAVDQNNFRGKTWYRLKQEDVNGTFTYSVIRMVNGNAEQTVVLKAWPIPAPKEFSVTMTGAGKDVLQVFDLTGKQVQQLNVTAGEVVKISHLLPGIYVIKLRDQKMAQKVVVQ